MIFSLLKIFYQRLEAHPNPDVYVEGFGKIARKKAKRSIQVGKVILKKNVPTSNRQLYRPSLY